MTTPLITQNKFIDIFDGPNSRTLDDFIKTANVKSGAQRISPLYQYMKEHNIPKSDIKLLYDHIIARHEYLARFYKKSLMPTDEHKIDEESPMPLSNMNNDQKTNYKNIIRNLHYADILKNTKSGLENVPTFFDVLNDLYKKEIIDYKILTPSARHYIKEGRIGSVFSSYYFRASIMNPYLVYSLEKRLLKGERIFSPTLGWSSYAYGFLECPEVKEYVATDVIPRVCKVTKNLCQNYYPHKKTTIYCEPSERLAQNRTFMTTYREHFDVVFFSPPYYELEKYPGANQSTTTYKTYEEWLQLYWETTIRMCHHVLKRGGRLCYILSSYGSTDKTDRIDLLKDMNAITKKIFTYIRTIPMKNKNVHVTADSHRETGEKIVLFIKE